MYSETRKCAIFFYNNRKKTHKILYAFFRILLNVVTFLSFASIFPFVSITSVILYNWLFWSRSLKIITNTSGNRFYQVVIWRVACYWRCTSTFCRLGFSIFNLVIIFSVFFNVAWSSHGHVKKICHELAQCYINSHSHYLNTVALMLHAIYEVTSSTFIS